MAVGDIKVTCTFVVKDFEPRTKCFDENEFREQFMDNITDFEDLFYNNFECEVLDVILDKPKQEPELPDEDEE